MDINAITATATGNGSKAARDAASLAENFDDFLKLLTTQLRHQDPLSPMESNEFVSQLVQFTGVEQSINTNRNLEKLLDMQVASQAIAGLGYIGKTVEAASEYGTLQDGKIDFAYSIGANMETTSIGIYDLSGKLVYSAEGGRNVGKHSFTWDGTTNTGEKLDSGSYRIAVSGSNEASAMNQIPTAVIGSVTGLQNAPDGLLLTIGEINIPLGNVVAVRDPEAAA
jgi:flagellar basal-body rod modification protein FlgD